MAVLSGDAQVYSTVCDDDMACNERERVGKSRKDYEQESTDASMAQAVALGCAHARICECASMRMQNWKNQIVGLFLKLLKRRRGRRCRPEGDAEKEVRPASPTMGRCSSTAALAAVTAYMAKVDGRSVVAAWNIPALTARSTSITLAVNGPQVRSTALLADSPADAILRAVKCVQQHSTRCLAHLYCVEGSIGIC